MNIPDEEFIVVGHDDLPVPFGKYMLFSEEIVDKLRDMLTEEQRKDITAHFVAVVDHWRSDPRLSLDERIKDSFPPTEMNDDWISDPWEDDDDMGESRYSISADLCEFFPKRGRNPDIEEWLIEQNPRIKEITEMFDCEASCFYAYFKTKEAAQEFIRLVNELIAKDREKGTLDGESND